MNIDFELYRIFYVVAETLNITKASNTLNISQPAVTKHIKNLEDQLGTQLFIRTKRGVILTDTGKEFYNNIKKAITCIDTAEKQIMSEKALETGTIKVGISTTLTRIFLLKYIEMFHKLHPNIIIKIDTDPTSILKKKLKEGLIDIIIAKIPSVIDNELEVIKIDDLHPCFIVNEEYKELIKNKVKIKDLNKYPLLLQNKPSNSRDYIDTFCIKNNIELESIMDISSSSLLVDFVKIGYGVGFVTEEYITKELKNKEVFKLDVEPKLPPIPFGIIKLKDGVLGFGAKQLVGMIKFFRE